MQGRACWRRGLLPLRDFELDKFQSFFRSLQCCSRNDRDAIARASALREARTLYASPDDCRPCRCNVAVCRRRTGNTASQGCSERSRKRFAKDLFAGLEQFMNVILIEHNKLWFAGQARNWPLAAYELGEIKEVMSGVQDHIPTFKNLPLADMLDAVNTKEIAALEKAIDAKDFKTFAVGYDQLTAACNACHQGTENGFIVIKRIGRASC